MEMGKKNKCSNYCLYLGSINTSLTLVTDSATLVQVVGK